LKVGSFGLNLGFGSSPSTPATKAAPAPSGGGGLFGGFGLKNQILSKAGAGTEVISMH